MESAKRPSRSRTAEKGKASKKSSEKDEGKKPLLPPTTPAQPSLMSPLPSLTPPRSSGALGLAVNSGHQSGVDLTTSVGSWLKSLTHRSGSGSASGSGPGSGPGSGSGSRSKQVPAWVSAKPKPLKKLSQSPVAPQVTSAADDGIFDEVILMLEKEGEKEKQEKMRKAAKKEAKRRRAERGTGDLASSSALGKKAEGSSVVETVDLLGSPLPERTEQKLPLTPGSEGVDLMAAFEKEKRKMEEQWEEERRLREAELAEMERQVRLAKEKSKLVCSPPPNWFSQVEGRNLMVVELPFQPVQHASKRKKRGEKSSPGGSDTPAETDADVLMISEMLQNAGYLERATKVFRVQNTKLWTKYNLWKRDIREEVGKSHLNERHLWHGADMETIGKIINEGFDARVSHLSGSLGGGIYFSESMEYSEGYSRMPAHSVGPANVGKPKPKHRRSGKRKMVENLDDFFYTTFSTSVDPVTQMPIPEAYEMGMLLSRVVLGKSCPSSGLVNNGTLRKAPDGYHSVSHKMHPNLPIHAIYDNPQAYPEFLIFFR